MTDKKLLLTFSEEAFPANYWFNGQSIDRFRKAPNWIKVLLPKVPYMPLKVALNLPNKSNKFLILFEVGTVGTPLWWTGLLHTEYKDSGVVPNVVEMLPEKLKEQLRDRTAIVHYEQSWEGFPMIGSVNYFKKFYKNFAKFQLPPSQFILTTSNLLESALHDEWCNQNSITDRMTIVSANFFAALSAETTFFGKGKHDINFDEQLQYKLSNYIVLFNCLNRVMRDHRICFIAMLNHYNLLESNKVSHNKFPDHFNTEIKIQNFRHHNAYENNNVLDVNTKLPLILDSTEFEVNKAQNFFKEVYLDSWVTVVTETLATETNTMFFSEKIYKPMRARHPFILLGIRGSLRELKRLGFKTFDNWWDESYDDIENITDRMEAICKLLLSLQIKTKDEWIAIYKDMQTVLEHNYNHLHSQDWVKPLSSYVAGINNE
jgi:hypothetical protein